MDDILRLEVTLIVMFVCGLVNMMWWVIGQTQYVVVLGLALDLQYIWVTKRSLTNWFDCSCGGLGKNGEVMNKVSKVYNAIGFNGTSAKDISVELGFKLNTVSGILSQLKNNGKVANAVDKKWYKQVILTTKETIADMMHACGDKDTSWYEGYVCGLAANEIITEKEYDLLLDWIIEENKNY